MNTPKKNLTKEEKDVIRKDINNKGGNRKIIEAEYDLQLQKIEEDIQNLIQQKKGVTQETIIKAFNEEIAKMESDKKTLMTKKENFDIFIKKKTEQIVILKEKASREIESKEKYISELEDKLSMISEEIGELIEQKKGVNKESILSAFDEEIAKLNEEQEKLESEIGIAKNKESLSVRLVKTLKTDKNIQNLYKKELDKPNEDIKDIKNIETVEEKVEEVKVENLKEEKAGETEETSEKNNKITLNEYDQATQKIMKRLELSELWKHSEENILIGKNKENDIILMDTNGEKIRTLKKGSEYSYLGSLKIGEGMIPFEENGKWGFVNKDGKKLIDAKFYTIEGAFKDGFCQVRQEIEDKINYGIIDKEGKTVIPFEYDYVSFYPKFGIAKFRYEDKDKDKYGIRLKNGKEIKGFDDFLNFNEEGCTVVKNYDDNKRRMGTINKDGSIVVKIEYDNIQYFDRKLWLTEKNGKKGIIDQNGSEVFECEYDKIEYNYFKKLFFLHKDGSTEIRDDKGKSLGKFNGNVSDFGYGKDGLYHEYTNTSNQIGFMKIAKGGLFGKGGYNVKKHMDPELSETNECNSDILIANKYGKYGVLNLSTKKHLINFEYDDIIFISASLFLTKKEGMRSLKNIKTGSEIFINESIEKCEYIIKRNLDNTGIIKATTKEGKIGFISLDGKIIHEPELDNYGETGYYSNILTIQKDEKWGLMNITGEVIVEPTFEKLGDSFKGPYKVMIAKKDGKWGLIDEKGTWVVDPQFEEKIYISPGSNSYTKYGNCINYFTSGGKTYFMNGEEI